MRKRHALTAAMLLLALLGVAAARGVGGRQAVPPAAPELLPPSHSCPRLNTPVQRRRMQQRALSMMSRYPFHPHEGPRALRLMRQLRDCGDAADPAATRARQQLTAAWTARLQQDYRLAQLRLERALSHDDGRAQRSGARHLLKLLAGRTGAYVRWLERLAVK